MKSTQNRVLRLALRRFTSETRYAVDDLWKVFVAAEQSVHHLLDFCHLLLVLFTLSRFSRSVDNSVPNLCSFSGSFSSLSFPSISSIFVSRVDSSLVRKMGLVVSTGGDPSLTTITRFLHCPHQSSPLGILNSGEAHAGQGSSVRVAPCRSRSAMPWMSVCSLDNFSPHKGF